MPRRVLQGVVVSDVNDKTILVRVERRVKDPIYKKFVTTSKKYAAHDAENRYRIGDRVRIEESRPISKHKRWVVLGRAGEAAPRGEPAAAPAATVDAVESGAGAA